MSDSGVPGGAVPTVHDRPDRNGRQETRLDPDRGRRYNPASGSWQDRPVGQTRRGPRVGATATDARVAPAGRKGAVGAVESGAAASSLSALPIGRLTRPPVAAKVAWDFIQVFQSGRFPGELAPHDDHNRPGRNPASGPAGRADTPRTIAASRGPMRFPAAILIAATLLSAGCTALTGRSGRDRDRDRDHPAVDQRDGDNRWWLDGSETARRKTRPVPADAGRTDRESLLAGMVVDRDGRPLRGVTYIRVRPADELTPASSRGIGFETDSDGNFLCAMLTPGKTYILSVVREIDGRKVAGEMQVKPPQTSLRLEVSEDRVSSVTPPLPPPPGLGPFEPHGPDARTSGDPPIGPPPLPDPPSPLLHKENIAGEPHRPPTAAIRPPPSPAPDTAPPLVTPPNIPEPEPPQAN